MTGVAGAATGGRPYPFDAAERTVVAGSRGRHGVGARGALR